MKILYNRNFLFSVSHGHKVRVAVYQGVLCQGLAVFTYNS
jgi:hypothetical protein